MKRFFYTATILATLGFSSCQDFLETTPDDFVTPANYYRNEEEVNAALAGVYDILGRNQTYGRTLWWELDVADQFFDNRSNAIVDMSLNNYDATDTKVAGLWEALYLGINRANMLLENLDKADMPQDAKTKVLGQAKFLRAYYYFLLVTNWGDVPLRLNATASVKEVNVPKTASRTIYDFIVKEMEEAEAMVDVTGTKSPNSTTVSFKYNHSGRVTNTVVQGILARVNLKMAGAPLNDRSRYNEVIKWATKVKESGLHSLNPSYKQIFINHMQDRYDLQYRESMWEAEFASAGPGLSYEEGSLGVTGGINTGDPEIGYSYGIIQILKSHYDLYPVSGPRTVVRTNVTPATIIVEDSRDTRRDWNIAPFYYSGKDTVAYSKDQIYNRKNGKWRRIYQLALPKNNNSSPANFPILRYADVLLMLAEAENAVNGPTALAKDAVNQVIRRAYAVTPDRNTPGAGTPDDVSEGVDQDQLLTIIQEERAKELFSEGLRKFDLIRWGEYLYVMRALSSQIAVSAPSNLVYAGRAATNVTEKHLLLPIPTGETTLNNAIVQNSGW
ncbi:RagB/SusD family nutrient uptake outer membrane protein [Rufibacter immobilis]|nr:RagB/SusD family nutrient uptake outer membrane protein [Rufibacter immobilis]